MDSPLHLLYHDTSDLGSLILKVIRIISKERTLNFIRGEVVELIEIQISGLLQAITSLLLFFGLIPLSQKLIEIGSITCDTLKKA